MRYISKCGEDRKSTSEQEHFLYSGQEPGTFYCRAGTGKNFVYNEGYCPIHEHMQIEEIKAAKAQHPAAEVLAHPECPKAVLAISDYVGSTSGIIDYATKSEKQEFIICTENGVRYKLEKDNPDKKFYFTETEPVCMDMKLITLERILHVLKTGENEVHLSEELRTDSRKPLEKMLELAK